MASPALRGVAATLLALLLSLSCSGDGKRAAGTGRTIVLVTVESLRADAVLPPAVERLAVPVRRFTDAVAASPMSRPSVASILTGVVPDRSSVRDSLFDRLPDEIPTIAERLDGAGWTTGAFVGSPSCAEASGLARGFDVYDAPAIAMVGPGRLLPQPRPAAEVTGNAEKWIGGLDPKADVFAWVHLGDLTTVPFALEDVKTSPEAYAAAVAALDAPLATILGAAAKRPGAELVLAGTHGLHLGEGGRYGDSFWIDDVALRVPLVWSGGRARPGSDPRPTWLPDIAATIAASAGVALAPSSEGVDLAAPVPPERPRLAWSWAPEDQEGWPTLASSPDRPATPRPRPLSASARARVEAAGVRLGATPKVWKERPRDSEEIVRCLGRARYYVSRGQTAHARVEVRKAFEKYPDDLGLRTIHLHVAWMMSKREPVKETVDKLLTLYPDRQEALHWLAHFETAAKRPEAGEALSLAALEAGPRDPDLLYDLACARSLAGDVPAALQWLREAIDAGFHEWDWMEKDTDLAAVRASPRYAEFRRAAGR